MKARIYNNQFAGLHNLEWLNNNQEKVIGGQLVSEWQLTDILPNETLLKPIWNGSEWIEGATKEQIQQQELEQKKILKQQQYEELLPTDWYVVRFIETGIAIPEEILQQRQAIREKYE
jgi:hypothetical protein